WADEEQKVYEQIGDRKYFQEYRYAPGLYMEIQGIMKGGREFWVKHMREEKERYDVAKFPSDLGIVWDMAEVKKNVRRLNDLQRLWDEETTKFIMGIRPLDEYDAFVQQMNKSGLDDWITEYTRQYNALKK
ncbi:MAG: hypothetical protein GY801_22355, partial [bacterium]|nr:hypothetical protein [bacterium]